MIDVDSIMSELYMKFKALCHVGDNNEMQKCSPNRRSTGTDCSFLESHSVENLCKLPNPQIIPLVCWHDLRVYLSWSISLHF